ncbi:hypothetical protein [Streptomyces puniciscabiei]
MKRRLLGVLALAVAGLMLYVVPAAARDGRGEMESSDWNLPLTNIGL